jgi:effector-binding domain-containing protein
MKKGLLIVFIVLLVGAGFFYILFVKHEFKKTVHLNMPITTVTAQFAYPVNLKKWFSPFAAVSTEETVIIDSVKKIITTGNYSVQVSNQSIYSTLLTYSNGKKEKQFILSASPDTGKSSQTDLTLVYKDSYFKKWFGSGELVKNAVNSFNDFDEYLNDTKRMYGFEINPVKVIDTAFLFIRRTVPLAERQTATKDLFEELISYAEKRNAGYNGVRIFYSLRSGDEITLFASIGISNRIEIPSNEPYEYKMMPFEKNLLEATYQGPYAGAEKVYEALRAYKEDRNLTSMAIPFQKFVSDGYDFADDQIVQLKVYYPVF